MASLLFHNIAAGLVLAWACGDSRKESATGQMDTSPSKTIAAAQPADLCALLTEAEAEAILGKQLAPPERQSSGDCWYSEASGSGPEIILHVLPVAFKSKEAFHAFLVKETKETNEKLKEAMGNAGATIKGTTVEPVPEVGAPAYYADPTLFVLRGDRVLAIFAARPQAAAIGAKALPRFR
jgi:hypothetical protein